MKQHEDMAEFQKIQRDANMEQRPHAHHRDHYYQQNVHRGSNGPPHPSIPQKRNYKLLIDPFLIKGAAKTYRFEGLVDGETTMQLIPLRDPRKSKIWIRPEAIDLQVPRFKIDSNYVGEPPPIEVTIFNVNDNIDHQFLHNEIVNKHQCGPLDDLQIFTHELSRKHLGIARIIFEEVECARMCVRKMNAMALMGRTLKVFLDPFGRQCDKKVNEIIGNLEDEARREEEAKEARKRPAPPPTIAPPEKVEPQKERQEKEKPSHRFEEEQKSHMYTQPYRDYRDQPSSHINSYTQGNTSSTSSPAPPYSYQPPVHVPSHQDTQQYNYPYQDYRSGYQQSSDLTANHQWPTNSHSNNGPNHRPTQWPNSISSSTKGVQEFHAETTWDQNYHDKKSVDISPAEDPDRISDSDKNQESGDDEKHSLDLETRIALLLQNKDTNIATPFLNLAEDGSQKADSSGSQQSSSSGTDSETPADGGEDRVEEIPPPLSTPPSPFISKEVYLSCYESSKEMQLEAQRKDLIENQERLRKIKKRRHKKKHQHNSEVEKEDDSQVNGIDDDRMSLSSLSTNEDPILHQDIPVPGNFSAPPPGYQPAYSSSEHFPSYIPPSYPPPQHVPAANYWQPGHGYGVVANGANYAYNSNYMSCAAYPPPTGSSYLPGGTPHIGVPPPGNNMYPWQSYPSVQGPDSRGHQTGHYHDPTVNSILDKVIEELKVILNKDLIKRMTEGIAFKTYESWWDEHETEFKSRSESKSSSELASSVKPEMNVLSTLFESKEGFGADGSSTSFGLGFRAAMPKMPSFRKIRKIKPPSPPCLDDDSKGLHSDEDSKISSTALATGGISSSSDSEDEGGKDSRIATKPTTSKKLSWTSNESADESEASSQSSEEESEESSPSESESSLSSSDDEQSSQPMDVDVAVQSTDKLLLQKEREMEQFTTDILMEALKTPERESRSVTPLPDQFSEDWMESEITPVQTKTSVPKPLLESPAKAIQTEMPVPAKGPTPVKVSIQKLENEASCEETDTADEKEDNNLDGFVDSRRSPKDNQRSPVTTEHSYCLPWAPKNKSDVQYLPKGAPKKIPASKIADRDYTRPQTPPREKSKPKPRPPQKIPGNESSVIKPLRDHSNREGSFRPTNKSMLKFKARNPLEECNTLYSFLIKGIDQEDLDFLKRSYERMMTEDVQGMWLNDALWVPHPPTDVPSPPKKKRKLDDLPLHKTGCARTEGFYKVDSKQKQKHKFTFQEEIAAQSEEPQRSLAVLDSSKAKPTQISVGREVRSFQRRLLTAYGNETASDLLKFNQLKFRKKNLKFGKSLIHDWGLFALEAIAAGEMVIEYVGQNVRAMIADVRENQYEKMGIGSSYLFRIDNDNIIDATKGGNLARFINHSCNPNCNARIITVETRKKIVIYSKQAIACGEEITYDYKFPIEDQKIICLCGAPQCKGSLN